MKSLAAVTNARGETIGIVTARRCASRCYAKDEG